MTSETNSEVSVIILTKNSARTISGCLESIVSEKPREILVVDGSSTDATPEILNRYGVTVLKESVGSLGYCRQMAAQTAKRVYVMFVDSDVKLTPGCISALRRELEDYGWAAAQAQILSAENVSYWQRAEDQSCRQMYAPGPTNQVDTIATLFRREVLLSCPFDASFKDSYEDVDLSRRLIKAGYRLGRSNAIAYHYHRREFQAFFRQRFRGGLGRAWFGLKCGGIPILLGPLASAFSQIVRNAITKNVRFVPYWVAGGLAEFLGVLAGLSRSRREFARSANTRMCTSSAPSLTGGVNCPAAS